MPGFLTHYIAGQALLNELDKEVSIKIKNYEKLFNLGTQGPDIFFYYFPGQILKRSRGVGSDMHQSNLGLVLLDMSVSTGLVNALVRDKIFAYTAGFMMHYLLDAFAHPYVYAKTFKANAPRIKNSADHRKFETAIDIKMLDLVRSKKPAELKQWQLINANKNQMNSASEALSNALKNVYKRNIPTKTIERAMRHMVYLTRLLESKNGKRKRLVELVENISIKEPLYSSMVHTQKLTDDVDYLNTKKTSWSPPWAKEEISTDSFVERYQNSIKECVNLVETLYEYVYKKLDVELLAAKIGNLSLKTGKPCQG